MTASPLIEAAIAGQAQARETLWTTHRRWLAAVLLAHAPRQADVEDLLQEVAVAFVRSIGKLADASAFRAWLRTIAINTARSAARRRELPRSGGDAAAIPDQAAIFRAQSQDSAEAALTRVAELPIELREPLLLKAVEGMSQRDIANALGLTVEAVESRIARARRRLRATIAATDGVHGCKN